MVKKLIVILVTLGVFVFSASSAVAVQAGSLPACPTGGYLETNACIAWQSPEGLAVVAKANVPTSQFMEKTGLYLTDVQNANYTTGASLGQSVLITGQAGGTSLTYTNAAGFNIQVSVRWVGGRKYIGYAKVSAGFKPVDNNAALINKLRSSTTAQGKLNLSSWRDVVILAGGANMNYLDPTVASQDFYYLTFTGPMQAKLMESHFFARKSTTTETAYYLNYRIGSIGYAGLSKCHFNYERFSVDGIYTYSNYCEK